MILVLQDVVQDHDSQVFSGDTGQAQRHEFRDRIVLAVARTTVERCKRRTPDVDLAMLSEVAGGMYGEIDSPVDLSEPGTPVAGSAFVDNGQQLIVEGRTFGNDGHGGAWDGGKTAGGRFCSVFSFNDQGLISRMYIYLDPDYTSLDKERFHWRRAEPLW